MFTNFCQIYFHPRPNFTKIILKAGKLIVCNHFADIEWKYKHMYLKKNLKVTLLIGDSGQ